MEDSFPKADPPIWDKHGRLAAVRHGGDVRLELGCADRRQRPGAITIDRVDSPAVDVVGDVLEVLATLADGTVDEIYSSHLLEHLPDIGRFLREASRVLRHGGTLETVVPHFSNPYFYSDPTHRSFFGLYTFSYFVEDPLLTRRVPQYEPCAGLSLVSVRLIFKSARVFPIQHALRRAFEALVNLSAYTREFYEANLSHLVPCYEIRFHVRKWRVG